MAVIRKLKKSDAEQIFPLMDAVNREDDLNYSLTKEWLYYVLKLESAGIAACFHNNNMTGLATCMINETMPEEASVNVLVHPDYRRLGRGKLLFSWILEFAGAKGVRSLETCVKERLGHSVSFAGKHGFQTALYSWEMECSLNSLTSGALIPQAMTLLPASGEDGDEYARMIFRCFGDELTSDVLMKMLEDPSVMVWLLREKERGIGCVSLQLKESIRTGYIFDVAVIPEERKKGYGRLMLMKCLEWLKKRGYEKASLMVTAENRKALGLYEALGFEVRDVDLVMLLKTGN